MSEWTNEPMPELEPRECIAVECPSYECGGNEPCLYIIDAGGVGNFNPCVHFDLSKVKWWKRVERRK